MKNREAMKRQAIIHPFLFAVHAVLGVYSINAAEIPVEWVVRPLFVLLLLMALIFILVQSKLKDHDRAGLITTFILFWLFFGHFHRTLFEESPFWNTLPGILLALVIWTTPLVLLGSTWAWNHITNRGFITSFLNLTSLFVIALPVYATGNSLLQIAMHAEGLREIQHSAESTAVLEPQAVQPDVYLIILDAYGREDFLREVYGFDNHEFIEYLDHKGFYIADRSTPNYPQTVLSLSSLLNMQYLDDFTNDLRNTNARGPVNALLQKSAVRYSLESVGYSFVAMPSATLFTQMHDADKYYKMTLGDINEFEGLLLSSTLANFVIDGLDLDVPVPSYALHRRYVLYSLDTLETVPPLRGPKFVFTHIMAPHPPFVLDENGDPVQSDRPYNMGDASGFRGTSEEYIAGYVGEVRYLNQRLMHVIDVILSQSAQRPIIIIQGDHGPGNYFNMAEPVNECLRERYSMLNAYYFPDGDYNALYESITPVNSFRVVLNQYFGANLDLLEDRNYYATWLKPYVFSDVTDQIESCQVKTVN